MQSTDSLSQQNNYIQMSNMTSGASSSFLNTRSSFRLNGCPNVGNRLTNGSSFEKLQQSRNSAFKAPGESKPNCCLPESPELDETSSKDEANQENDSNSNAVYNFPWDFKLKANPLLIQM